jgi:hypothetical protein
MFDNISRGACICAVVMRVEALRFIDAELNATRYEPAA